MFEPRGTKGMWIRKGVGIFILVVAALAALGFVVMHLWNGLMPGIFGFRTLGFCQAVGLLVLSRILFGGLHRGHGHSFRHRQHMIRRWESMTPEEREKFRQGFKGRFWHCCEPPKA